MPGTSSGQTRDELHALEQSLTERGGELALFLTYDRPARLEDRPGLSRAFFAQRCVSDTQLDETVDAFRAVGAYVELFEGELPLLAALAEGRLHRIDRGLKVVYNGIEGGVTAGGFEPGRNALIPAVADAYGLASSNANAYACALGRHKFHYLTLLRALGVQTPRVWHYRPLKGWAYNGAPPLGVKVIVKSTYESWSVGVTDDSIFVVDALCDDRVAAIAMMIGQPVTVQEFVRGREVCVPVLAYPDPVATPPMEAILAKAPGDGNAVMTIDDTLRPGAVTHRPFRGASAVHEQSRAAALSAFDILQFGSFARIDFRVDDDDTAWVIDVGVSPGVSVNGSAYKSLAQFGFDHAGFLRVVIAATLRSRGLL